MKTYIAAVIFSSVLCTLPSIAAAVPHVIEAQDNTSKAYISDLIIRQSPVRFQIKKEASPSQTVVSAVFASWFQNVLNRLDPSREEQLAPLLEAIRFGAQTKNYVLTDQQPDITFYFDNQDTRSSCGRGSGGCFFAQNMKIYVKTNSKGLPISSYLTHEIGHSLRMQDLYDEEFRPDNTMFGSGAQPSIMKDEHTLTCDDADAVVNALYIAAKKQHLPLPDISFSSFCSAQRTFKNARQLNRKPFYIDYNDSRTVYTFCQDGTTHSITRITPSNPGEIYKIIQAPVDCPYIAENYSPFRPEENASYQIRSFTSDKVLEQKEIPSAASSITYFPLPSGGFTLALRANNGLTNLPGQVYITDEKGKLVYLLAYLHNGYNFVYNFFLNGSDNSTQGFIFVYDREHPDQYYSYTNPQKAYACHAEEQKCRKMEDILNTYTNLFIQKLGLRKPIWGGFSVKMPQTYIKEASAWEKKLLQFYPQVDLGRIIRKDISVHLKSAAEKQMALKKPSSYVK